jgi:hypothetical protein
MKEVSSERVRDYVCEELGKSVKPLFQSKAIA